MEALYVCHFSDGHIKVGRSIDPESRIDSHADRVSCLGVELLEHHFTELVSLPVRREAALIEQCVKEATGRHKNEWFLGLNYEEVCGWADGFAYAELRDPGLPNNGIGRAIAVCGSTSGLVARLGGAVSRQNIEHWLSCGYVPFGKCALIAIATGITPEELNPSIDWDAVRQALALSPV